VLIVFNDGGCVGTYFRSSYALIHFFVESVEREWRLRRTIG